MAVNSVKNRIKQIIMSVQGCVGTGPKTEPGTAHKNSKKTGTGRNRDRNTALLVSIFLDFKLSFCCKKSIFWPYKLKNPKI